MSDRHIEPYSWRFGGGHCFLHHQHWTTHGKLYGCMLWFFLAFYLFFGIGIGVSSLVMALVTAALPQRKARVFGARKVRFPFAIVGWFEIVGGTLLLLYLFSVFLLYKLFNHLIILFC